MGSSRLTKKERKIKSLSASRRRDMKNQSFKPVMASVDIEKVKADFAAKATAAGAKEGA